MDLDGKDIPHKKKAKERWVINLYERKLNLSHNFEDKRRTLYVAKRITSPRK